MWRRREPTACKVCCGVCGRTAEGRPACAEQKESVEGGEEFERWLVDGGDDSAASARECPQDGHDIGGHLCIQPGGGLIAEEHRRVGQQFKAYADTLALPTRQPALIDAPYACVHVVATEI